MGTFRDRWKRKTDNQWERLDFVTKALSAIPSHSSILDAGAGSQRYKRFCGHLEYFAQDFGQYTTDNKPMLGGARDSTPYDYGHLHYVCDIWQIPAADESFDAILCTEVLEHVPFPEASIAELARLLRPGGTLILTVPSNCLRHMDPYFFFSGFSDRWLENLLPQHGLSIESLEPVGDYYRWMFVEVLRTARSHSALAKAALAPALLYFGRKKPSELSTSTLCMGYHVIAKKGNVTVPSIP